MTHTCPKCLGTGNISAFGHISGGRCFTCGGTGKVKGHVGVVAQAQAKPYKAARRHASGGWEVDVMSGRVWLWDDGSTMVSNGLARRSEWAIQTARGLVAKAA